MSKKLKIVLITVLLGVFSLPVIGSPCDKLEKLRIENEWQEYTDEEHIIKGECIEEIMTSILNTDDRLLPWEVTMWKKDMISTMNEEEKSKVLITKITEPIVGVAPEKSEARLRLEKEIKNDLNKKKREVLDERYEIRLRRTEEEKRKALEKFRRMSESAEEAYEQQQAERDREYRELQRRCREEMTPEERFMSPLCE